MTGDHGAPVASIPPKAMPDCMKARRLIFCYEVLMTFSVAGRLSILPVPSSRLAR